MKTIYRKYSNQPTEVNGLRFASQAEARRYGELRLLEKAGAISSLVLQPRFDIEVNGVHICYAIPDFQYYDLLRQQTVVEDVKSPPTRTRLYLLKKRLLKVLLDVEVEEW